jgi:hypothetical protein
MYKNVRHPLRNELERLDIILVLIELLHVVPKIDLRFTRLLLHFVEQKPHVLTRPLLYLRSDVDVGNRRPRQEEIVEKLHEILLTDLTAILLRN